LFVAVLFVSFVILFIYQSISNDHFHAYCLLLNMPLRAIREVTVSLLEEGNSSELLDERPFVSLDQSNDLLNLKNSMTKPGHLCTFSLSSVEKEENLEALGKKHDQKMVKHSSRDSMAKTEREGNEEVGKRGKSKRPSQLELMDEGSGERGYLIEEPIPLRPPFTARVGAGLVGSGMSGGGYQAMDPLDQSPSLFSPAADMTSEFGTTSSSPSLLVASKLSDIALISEIEESLSASQVSDGIVIHEPVLLESNSEFKNAVYKEVTHRKRRKRKVPSNQTSDTPYVSPIATSPFCISPRDVSCHSPLPFPSAVGNAGDAGLVTEEKLYE
jgi:hypothetical protein